MTKSPNVHIDDKNNAANARNSLPLPIPFASVMKTLLFQCRAPYPA